MDTIRTIASSQGYGGIAAAMTDALRRELARNIAGCRGAEDTRSRVEAAAMSLAATMGVDLASRLSPADFVRL